MFKALLLSGLLLFSSVSWSEFAWDVSGFATLGAGKLNREDLMLMDYDDSWSFKSDSVAGVQFLAEFNNSLSITSQILAKGFTFDDTSSFEPEFEWLFLSYQMGENTRTRIGRLRTPFYLFSETLDVGYSQTWVRPPVDVYAFLIEPFSAFNGADLQTTFLLDSSELDFQIFLGQAEGEFAGYDIEVEPIFGLNVTWHKSEFLLRYGFQRLENNIENPELRPLVQGFEQASAFSAEFQEISEQFYLEDGAFHYHILGAQWEHKTWSVIYEHFFLIAKDDGFSNDTRGWYVSLANRWGELTPYFVIGRYVSITNSKAQRLIQNTYNTVPAGFNAGLDALRQTGAFVAEQFNAKERTYTAGVRWDFLPNTDLKIEYQYFELLKGSTGNLFPLPGAERPENVALISISLDVVF